MLRKLKWQIPGEPLAARYNWCRGPAVEKHCSIWLLHPEDEGSHCGPSKLDDTASHPGRLENFSHIAERTSNLTLVYLETNKSFQQAISNFFNTAFSDYRVCLQEMYSRECET